VTVRLFGCVCGQYHGPAKALGMFGERATVPLPFYVIEHPKGVALYDCGLHTDLCNPDDSYLRDLRAREVEVTFGPEDTTTHHLERLDIDPQRIRWVVLSHLHFDHVGGLHQVPNATIVVQRREWTAGFDRELAAQYRLPRRFFDLGHQVMQIDGEHDLFGDGSVTCIPSFGHTPGHQSMRVRSDLGDHILVGDACNNRHIVNTRHFPDRSDPRHAEVNRSLDELLSRREVDTVMVYGHDPEQWGHAPVLPSIRG
jgi:N-acyl homoserine lactone hydrolase